MKKIHKERLIKLYEYMKQHQGKLYHKKFDFGTYFNTCSYGTCGCMAGELPTIFPKYWRWISQSTIQYLYPIMTQYSPNFHYVFPNIKSFFGITDSEAHHLFSPGKQLAYIDKYYRNHDVLSTRATKRQVVANLHRFLKIKGVIL